MDDITLKINGYSAVINNYDLAVKLLNKCKQFSSYFILLYNYNKDIEVTEQMFTNSKVILTLPILTSNPYIINEELKARNILVNNLHFWIDKLNGCTVIINEKD
jgi:hypothetical protein